MKYGEGLGDNMSTNEKKAVALSSVFASAAMTIGKFAVGFTTGSLGIISEGLHSFLDLGAAALTYMAVRVSDKPADPEHPYGHGKVESVAALVETGLLFLTCIWILYEAVHRLLKGGQHVEVTWWAVAVILVSIIIDISRARALKRVAKKTNSQALEADALHFSSDVLSSAVVLVGLGFVYLGWPKADSIAAIGVSISVCYIGWKLGKRTIDTLIDTAPQGAAQKITELANTVSGVAKVQRVRVRPAGSVLFVDIEVAVGRGLSQQCVVKIQQEISTVIRAEMPEAEVNVLTQPLALDDETVHEHIRIIAFNHNAAVHHVTVHRANDKPSVCLDLEVDGHKSIQEAHDMATHLENDIRDEFGGDIEVETHIEPLQTGGTDGEDVTIEELDMIKKHLERLLAERNILSELHKIRARQTTEGLIVIFHCRVEPNRTVAEVHKAVDDIERRIRLEHPGIWWRIVAHAEPIIADEFSLSIAASEIEKNGAAEQIFRFRHAYPGKKIIFPH
jgi:cation diffusion facilitator family transporter